MARYKITVEFESEGLEHKSKTLVYYTDDLVDSEGVSAYEIAEYFSADEFICEEPGDCWSITDVTVEDTHDPVHIPAVAAGYMHDSSKHWPKEGK
jgi:hypothetical protein